MLMNIGFGTNAGVYDENGTPHYVMSDFFGALTPKILKDAMGGSYSAMVLTVITMFVGLFVIIILAKKGVNAAVLIGMLVASVVNWVGQAVFLGQNPFASLASASFVPPFSDMVNTTLFKFDFATLSRIGVLSMISVVVTFCIIDMFDTIGTLVGTASRAGLVDKEGNMPNMKEALISDAVGTITGSLSGTSTITTFIESAAGVAAGGRTGLTALTTAALFLASIFLAPIAAVIPPSATSSALIYVGILMLSGLKGINFNNIDETAPLFVMMISMPISGSIGHGIGLALITYCVIKIFSGEKKDVSTLTLILAILFLVKFFVAI